MTYRTPIWKVRRHLPVAASAVFWLALTAFPAQALPSFARQTGEECTSCHVGAIGPQLTPHGQKFKITAYSDGKSPSWYVPLSAQAIGGYTNTSKGQPGGASAHYSPNDNTEVQEASVFVAGRLADNLGIFSQYTYSGIDHASSWDNLDARFARTVDIGGTDTVLGVSLNNSPTTQDPFNTLAVWGFPYTFSKLSPGYLGAPMINGGLGQQVLGLTAYGYWNDWVYLEGGFYRGLPGSTLRSLGIRNEDQVHLKGPAPYARLNVGHGFNRQYASVGVFGMNSSVLPDPTSEIPDKFHDVGVDASYEYLGTRRHIFTLNSRYTRENQALYNTFGNGGSDALAQKLAEYNINGSYYFRNTYGATIARFGTHGTADGTLYPAADISGSRVGAPNTQGMIYQIDYTPFGKENSFLAPWLNLRLALQYTAYEKFNGARGNYDDGGRNASDNNTIFAWAWLAL